MLLFFLVFHFAYTIFARKQKMIKKHREYEKQSIAWNDVRPVGTGDEGTGRYAEGDT
jgi:hypothetical protein